MGKSVAPPRSRKLDFLADHSHRIVVSQFSCGPTRWQLLYLRWYAHHDNFPMHSSKDVYRIMKNIDSTAPPSSHPFLLFTFLQRQQLQFHNPLLENMDSILPSPIGRQSSSRCSWWLQRWWSENLFIAGNSTAPSQMQLQVRKWQRII